jgi:hypothetical protein
LEAAATDTGPAATDAILDLANALTRALRGEEGETVADLNARLRSVFEEFRLDTLHDGALGILPVLRADVTERYAEDMDYPLARGPAGAVARVKWLINTPKTNHDDDEAVSVLPPRKQHEAEQTR